MDRQTAAQIAARTSDAINLVDELYRSYADYLKTKKGSVYEQPPDFRYLDKPGEAAFVATSRHTGEEYQKVTYEELRRKLTQSDRDYVDALDKALSNLGAKWNATYQDWSMAEGAERKMFQEELDKLAPLLADPLIKLLNFVEKMGLWLDDHYLFARDIAADYLKAAGLEVPQRT